MSFGEKLKKLREDNNLQQTDIAQRLGLKGGNTISNYENDVSKPHLDNFIKLCKLFKVDPNYFLEEELSEIICKGLPHDIQLFKNKYDNLTNHDKEIVDYILNMKSSDVLLAPVEMEEKTTIYRFPVYKQDAAAGIGRLDVSDGYDMEEFVIDNIPDNAVFAMRINGDSMYDSKTGLIKDNSTVFINPKETVFEGKIVIASLDGEVVCKRYTTVEDHVEFKSDNEKRNDEDKDSRNYGECQVIGIVLGVIENERFIAVK